MSIDLLQQNGANITSYFFSSKSWSGTAKPGGQAARDDCTRNDYFSQEACQDWKEFGCLLYK